MSDGVGVPRSACGVPKAIVIVGNRIIGGGSAARTPQGAGSLAALETLGDSLVGRVADDLKRGGVESVAVFGDTELGLETLDGRATVVRCDQGEVLRRASRELLEYRDSGTDSVFFMRLGPYVEFDVADLLRFRTECEGSVVRAFEGPNALDIWLLDPKQLSGNLQDAGSWTELLDVEAVPYEVRGYVNALEHPRDLRRLVVDSLHSRCRVRPRGFEVRPGVWMAEGAQVEREARIVAPAFIGRDVCVSQQCLVTRGSNIERNSVVDYGTVIENTSVLPNTYVGIGLDVCHSIVDGNKLLNIQRDVLLEIDDSAVIREKKPLGEAGYRWWTELMTRELTLSAADEMAN